MMPLARRVRTAAMEFFLRLAPPRPPAPGDLERADFSSHPGGKGLRFTERLRDRLRTRWLRVRK